MTSATEGTAPPLPPRAPHERRHLWLKIGVPVIIALIVAIALYIWATLGYVYSTAQRTGYVQNLSKQGWLCKTWEGDLAVTPTPGSRADTLAFTIRNDSLAHALQAAAGKQVSLTYTQHKGVPTSCFGETEYYVESFRVDR